MAIIATVAQLLGPSAVGAQQIAYPNLVPDPPEPRAPSIYNDVAGTRFLVRFDGYVYNAGPGPLELRGTSPFGALPDRLMGQVVQRLYHTNDPDSEYEDLPSPAVLRYETSDGHQHWHLRHATRYSLWNYDRSVEVAPGHKIGFCLADIEAVAADAPPARYRYNDNVDRCAWLDAQSPDTTGPNAATTLMGVSPGWRDVYSWVLPLQWVDVANVPPGHYWLRSEVNPDSAIAEDPSAPIDPPAYSPQATTIPGYVAEPVERGHVAANASSSITLVAAGYGKDDAAVDRAFKIVEAPEHGTLTVAGGQAVGQRWWPTAAFTYTPDPNYFGPDSFRFVAGDYGRLAYPETPPAAVAAMQVGIGGPTALEISGAPAEVVAGGSAQLVAVVTAGPSPNVVWKVDGHVGGEPHIGTISHSGLFRAPDHLHDPGGDTVTISATTEDGISDEVDVRIVPPAEAAPLPDVAAPPLPPVPPHEGPAARPEAGPIPPPDGARRGRAARPRVAPRGRRIVLVRVVPSRGGRLIVVLTRGRARAGSCALRTVGGVAVTCRIRVPMRFAGKRRNRLTAIARVRSGGKVVQRWRIPLAGRRGKG